MGCVSAKGKKPTTDTKADPGKKYNTDSVGEQKNKDHTTTTTTTTNTATLAKATINESQQQQQQKKSPLLDSNQGTTNSAAVIAAKANEVIPSITTSQKQQYDDQIPKIPANPRSLEKQQDTQSAAIRQSSFPTTPAVPPAVTKIVDPAIDPSSLKGIAASLQIQQMRLSKTDKQQQQQQQHNQSHSVASYDPDDSGDMRHQANILGEVNYSQVRQQQPLQKDRILNKHMLSILSSINKQQQSKSCYSTPPVPLIASNASTSDWVQIETFGVYGNQNDGDNFMDD